MFTRAPGQFIQYSNQPASLGAPTWAAIPGATVNVTLPRKKAYTDWHVHRLDWTPGRSVFFLDDEQTNTTTLQVPVAEPPSGFYIDMWSANSTWSGIMEIGMNATLDVLWIEMLFNTTEAAKTTSSERVCTVQTGIVAKMSQSKGVNMSLPVLTVFFITGIVSLVSM